MRPAASLFERLVPAILMATSVTLLTAGLLSYAPSAFGEWQTPEPELIGGDPLLTLPPSSEQSARPASTPSPTQTATPRDLPSTAPGATASIVPPATPTPASTPTPAPTDVPRAFASRIRIPSLGIDLPVVPSDLVVRGNRDLYPLCDVAMYMREYVQPGEPGATYIYAHAQNGMFAPLLKASEIKDGASLVGALIEVYTSDNVLHLYELYRVKRHATDLSLANPPPGGHMLVLQTSEGPTGHVPKLQVAARPLTDVPASPSDANPRPGPRVCLPR